ncbi:uncharacterized protein B0T15DRAFT_538349 [Chaetomium strumarium]|uniref:Uncharacterized protein n=1 Tax=Chaetomium strumarium TaxID=1170767 RepID=A0AAJ0GMR8_9PEZI|nr:hypothetical protein B0T15DRAFT_538349 [Chaetomium strumarium]
MESSALTPSGSGAAQNQLTQQGSVDWIQLAKTTISFPMSVLARLAAADIAPHTIVVGQSISSAFVLSTQGMERFTEALKSLPSCSSIGDVIWFGFGIRHIVREIAQTVQGATLLTLCASLAELQSAKACAAILMHFTRVSGAPSELQPSPQQWINMVEACSGILRPTTFGCIADQFMAFSAVSDSSQQGEPEDVARALHAVALVSSNAMHSVTLVGGPSCGWIAAFGFFFLGLDVEIRRDSGSTLCYRSAADENQVRIFVHYDGSSTSRELQVCKMAYRVRTINKYISSLDDRYDHIMSGSVPWESCLSEAFGDSALKLLEARQQFGNMISSAARVFQGLTKAEPSGHFTPQDFQAWFGFQSGQSGFGFIDAAVFWFPELASLRTYISPNLSMSLGDAVEAYDQATLQVGTLCGCHVCRDGGRLLGSAEYCLTGLAVTLIFLVWNLSGLQLGADLKPYRSGLRHVYQLHVPGNPEFAIEGERISGYHTVETLISHLNLASVYHTAQFLFTTNLYPQRSGRFTAAAVGGICFYFDVLREVSDDPGSTAILHVLPGSIATAHGRKYLHVVDKMGMGSDGFLRLHWTRGWKALEQVPQFTLNYPCDATSTFGADDSVLLKDTGSHGLEASLIVEESPEALLADLYVSGPRGSCRVGVYTMLREIMESSGLVHCSHPSCAAFQRPLGDVVLVDGEGSIPETKRWVLYIRRLTGNALARCVGILVRRSWVDHIILRRRECIACCMTAAEIYPRLVYLVL